MIFDLHTHTSFSDGADTPEQMILSAIDKGLSILGISDHSFTSFDQSYCIPKEKLDEYSSTLTSLRDKYAGRIELRRGMEVDYYTDAVPEALDYRIGSVHYMKLGEEYVQVDYKADILRRAADKYFGGDIYSICGVYFDTVADVISRTDADIIGHFDLIKKFNADGSLFDESCPRYKKMMIDAADKLLSFGVPFEINTGAISRGYRDDAYPSVDMMEYILARGGRLLLSSDGHCANNIGFGFEKYEKFANADI